jgi:branched-chain amino acid transport system ATP-binding protein
LRARGVTILLAEQNMHFCLGIATHATVIDKGQIVYRATMEELRHNQEVKQRYLAI